MTEKDYQNLVKFGKEKNPTIFNNLEELRKKLAEFDESIGEEMNEIAKSILIQGRNVFAYALGKELIPEK